MKIVIQKEEIYLKERKEREASEERVTAFRRESSAKADTEEAAVRREHSERLAHMKRELSDQEAELALHREDFSRDRKAFEEQQENLTKKVLLLSISFLSPIPLTVIVIFAFISYLLALKLNSPAS